MPQVPECRDAGDSRTPAPVPSSLQICCHYFIIVLISWLATWCCRLIMTVMVTPEGGNRASTLGAPRSVRFGRLAGLEGKLSLHLQNSPGGGARLSVLHSGSAVSQGFSENFHVFFWVLFQQLWKPLGLIS